MVELPQLCGQIKGIKMKQNNVEVSIIVGNRPIREYLFEGRLYVEGKNDSEYSIRIKNNTYGRIKTVISIDGLNVINGTKASNDQNETGYVISAYNSMDIKGFRADNNSVGAFKFVQKRESYATENGSYYTNGIIGVRVYSEKINYIFANQYIDAWKQSNDSTFTFGSSAINCSMPMENTQIKGQNLNFCGNNVLRSASQIAKTKIEPFELGSTWGTKLEDRVIETTFELDSLITEFEIFYSSREGLKSLGVPMIKEKQIAFPRAFNGHYCNPTKGWK